MTPSEPTTSTSMRSMRITTLRTCGNQKCRIQYPLRSSPSSKSRPPATTNQSLQQLPLNDPNQTAGPGKYNCRLIRPISKQFANAFLALTLATFAILQAPTFHCLNVYPPHSTSLKRPISCTKTTISNTFSRPGPMENGTNVSPRKAHLPINPFQPKKLNPLPTHINGSTPKNSQSPPNHDLSTSNKSLRALIKAWSQFCREQHISWWLTHGTLLGWHWNTRILPSDTDLDIQMSVRELLYLAARFNQTLLNSRFLVDVSPSIVICSAQAYSTIDARLIDTKTGYLMDITGLAILDGSEDTVVCKKPHAYQLTDILPLHETVFEGVKAWRPHAAFADSEGGVPRGCVGVNHVQTVYNITDIQVERWRQRVDRFLKLE